MMLVGHWIRKMNDLIKNKINGYGIWFRFVTPVLIMLVAFNAREIFNDVRYIKQNMVIKSSYNIDKAMLERVLVKFDDRIREVETNGRRK